MDLQTPYVHIYRNEHVHIEINKNNGHKMLKTVQYFSTTYYFCL